MESIQGLFNEDVRSIVIAFWGHVIGVVILFLHKAHGVYSKYSLVDHDVIDMPQHMCSACMRHAYFFPTVCVLVRVVWTMFGARTSQNFLATPADTCWTCVLVNFHVPLPNCLTAADICQDNLTPADTCRGRYRQVWFGLHSF